MNWIRCPELTVGSVGKTFRCPGPTYVTNIYTFTWLNGHRRPFCGGRHGESGSRLYRPECRPQCDSPLPGTSRGLLDSCEAARHSLADCWERSAPGGISEEAFGPACRAGGVQIAQRLLKRVGRGFVEPWKGIALPMGEERGHLNVEDRLLTFFGGSLLQSQRLIPDKAVATGYTPVATPPVRCWA